MNRRGTITVTTLKDGRCIIERGRLPERPPMRTTIRLPADLIRDLKAEARRRGLEPDELATKITSTVSTEQLFDAVLGRVGEAVQRRSTRRS
jgi:hypothetical protein